MEQAVVQRGGHCPWRHARADHGPAAEQGLGQRSAAGATVDVATVAPPQAALASGEQAAVDRDAGPRDMPCRGTGQEGDRGGDVRRLRVTPERHEAALEVRAFTIRGIHVGVGRPGLHQVPVGYEDLDGIVGRDGARRERAIADGVRMRGFAGRRSPG